MTDYVLLKLAHLLLFVYWLGADIGVFYSARYVRDGNLTREARALAVRIMGWIDQLPRYCLVLMLPVGYTLAREVGVVRLPDQGMYLLWAIALVWLWAVWAIHHWQGTPRADRLRRIDLIWRWLLAFGLLWDAAQGFRGTGHLFADWISIKFVLFALLIFCGIMIRMLGKPIGPALRRALAEGSTPELEAEIQRGFSRTRPFVLTIWFLLLCAAWVGITKPDLP
ncbi:MAG: hypothetical protein KJS95_06340 [Gammaproteobacteria bacterium]|nr:hypothetical protein [Gammaproteobacteria bacterium]